MTVISDREIAEFHLPPKKSNSQRMRDSDWGTIIPSLAHCYFSELFCRALFVQKQYKHMFNLYRSSILNINVGGDSA